MDSDRNIQLGKAHDYLERIIDTLRAQRASKSDKGPLIAVLEHISSYIQVTRREIATLRNNDPQANLFASASDELEEVVSEAARATHEIMSAAEEIEKYGAKGGTADPALSEIVTRIYLACAFQDITVQRIAKVVHTLKNIESKVTALATACGGEIELRVDTSNDAKPDAGLLNGPQRAGAGHTQDEIDKLLASLG